MKIPKCDPDAKLGIGQAAAELGITPPTLRRYALAGLIPFQVFTAPSSVGKTDGRKYLIFKGSDLINLYNNRYGRIH